MRDRSPTGPPSDALADALADEVSDTTHEPRRSHPFDPFDPVLTRSGPQRDEVADSFIELGRTLGRGGMAEVRIGEQRKLGRSVALKTLRAEHQSPDDVARLVREARIAGRLEHPNIVPVHDLVVGADGIPQVVLKLIEGETWAALMRDEMRLRAAFGVEDLLEWNLEVLMTVCRATSFAHSKGILHRDVKPTNVMIGGFGEVYLVDWGVAFEMESDVDEEPTISGTHAYMSPEQVEADPALLGPWTDTYLLGATLHQILTGLPPHAHKPLEARIAELVAGTPLPALPSDIPRELRRIVEDALEVDPKRRTPTPEVLRAQLARYLRHRGALRMVERGHRARDAVARASDEATRERGWIEAEVAYRSALEEWPGAGEAIEGLGAVAVARVRHALARDDAGAAARILEAHPEMPESLRAQVKEAQARAQKNAVELSRFVADADRRVGLAMRGRLGVVFGVVWVGFWTFTAFAPPATWMPLIAFHLVVGAAGTAFILARGRQLFANRINRTSLSIVGSSLVVSLAWCVGASWMGLSIEHGMLGLLVVWALFASSMAHLIDAWGFVSAAGFLLAFLVGSARPALLPYAFVGANVVLLLNQVILNLARRRRGFEVPEVRAPEARRTER